MSKPPSGSLIHAGMSHGVFTQCASCYITAKKLEMDLCTKCHLSCSLYSCRSRQWSSPFAVVQGYIPCPLTNNELGCKWNSFCDCMFMPKWVKLLLYSFVFGWTLKPIHSLLANFGWYLVQVFIPYWSFEYTKAVTYTVVKVGSCLKRRAKILHMHFCGFHSYIYFFCPLGVEFRGEGYKV